jgi:hypothetical protein
MNFANANQFHRKSEEWPHLLSGKEQVRVGNCLSATLESVPPVAGTSFG